MVGATLRQGIHENNARSVCEFLLDEHLRHSSPDQSFATALGLALCVGGGGAADALVPVWYVIIYALIRVWYVAIYQQ
jgi:hypothetical protein